MPPPNNPPPAQQVPAVPPTFHFRLRLVDDQRLWDTSRQNRFAGLMYRITWGPDDAVYEGTVDPNGDVVRDLDGLHDQGTLDVGEQTHTGDFTVRVSLQIRRAEPNPAADELVRDRDEIARRLYNLGFYAGYPWHPEEDVRFELLRDAINRFVFRHYLTHPGAERDRYGNWREADRIMATTTAMTQLLGDLRALHDGS